MERCIREESTVSQLVAIENNSDQVLNSYNKSSNSIITNNQDEMEDRSFSIGTVKNMNPVISATVETYDTGNNPLERSMGISNSKNDANNTDQSAVLGDDNSFSQQSLNAENRSLRNEKQARIDVIKEVSDAIGNDHSSSKSGMLLTDHRIDIDSNSDTRKNELSQTNRTEVNNDHESNDSCTPNCDNENTNKSLADVHKDINADNKGEVGVPSPLNSEIAIENDIPASTRDLEMEVEDHVSENNQSAKDQEKGSRTANSETQAESVEVVEIDVQENSSEKNESSISHEQRNKRLARGSERENCIIPDTVDAISTANNNNNNNNNHNNNCGNNNDNENNSSNGNDRTENKKLNKKFDITPVRLEKLMDPQKLVGKITETSDENNVLNYGRPQRQAARKAETQIKEIVALADGDVEPDSDDTLITAVCSRCCLLRSCKWVTAANMSGNFCVENCYKIVTEQKLCVPKTMLPTASSAVRIVPTPMKFQTVSIRMPQPRKTVSAPINPLRKCAQCEQHIVVEEKVLAWEAMEFCNEDCLNRYQKKSGSFCQYSQCEKAVPHTSMGKYAVRFGLEARQFCSGSCLEEFKKVLKSCGYCQKDVTKLANTIRVTSEDKHSTKEFCSANCKKFYDCLNLKQHLPEIEDECTVCTTRKVVEFQVVIDGKTHPLCSDVCFSAFNFANNIKETDECHICKKYFEVNAVDCTFVFHEDTPFKFCSKVCTNVFILFKRKIVPCSWCKVKKYNFDMIKKTSNGLIAYLCSINCLTLYQVSINASSSRKIKCDYCSIVSNAQYHLTMSDATIRNFCSYNCVMCFQTQYSKNMLNTSDQNKPSIITTAPVPLGEPKKVLASPVMSTKTINNVLTVSKPNVAIANGFLPQISSTSGTTLKVASPITVITSAATSLTPIITSTSTVNMSKQSKYVQQIVVKPPEPKDVANKNTQCRPLTATKSVMCKPDKESVETQTDECSKYPALLPIPVPIYVPVPVMYSTPYPKPVPFPLPIAVPIFIPTTQKTFKGLTAKIKEILDKTPSNPYEADLLIMAKMVAGEERTEDEIVANENREEVMPDKSLQDANADDSDAPTDIESPARNKFDEGIFVEALNDVSKESSNSRSVDLEAELASNTITPTVKASEKLKKTEEPEPKMDRPRTRKRIQAQQRALAEAPPMKTRRRQSQQSQSTAESELALTNGLIVKQHGMTDSSITIGNDIDRPDAGMYLKYTIGIRGWKQWIIQKNEQIEQASASANKKAKTFNTNILKLTTDELNYLLCRFVKEVRKPNGTEYAPDTIYYLCLSIQQYLSENGRVDNIFTDPMYDQFTDALDEVAVKFSEVNESTQYVLTRVEEEHLWESKQLGAYSPHVLLATLMFFNTKYFNLGTIEEHMQLSFSHIMKHWKRNSNGSSGKPGSPAPNRNVLLRFYSPQAALDAPNSRKKKVYEQHENDTNPLRCPVRLYEFYLSKCPESVKQRNDLFYLQPERSCVPDSPVWYSTMPLQRDILKKILHRILMVKEVNVSLLAS